MFSEDIGVYGSLIFSTTPWKLHTRNVCIGGWQWQHSASDLTPNSSEPQIYTGGFSTVIGLRLAVKIVHKHKAWQTAVWLCLTGCYRVVNWHPSSSTLSRCYWGSYWLGTPDRYPDRYWDGEILDWPLLRLYMKRPVVRDGWGFCVHHLVVYQHYLNVLLCEVPMMLIPCRSHQTRWWINNDIVHYISNKHTNRSDNVTTRILTSV